MPRMCVYGADFVFVFSEVKWTLSCDDITDTLCEAQCVGVSRKTFLGKLYHGVTLTM